MLRTLFTFSILVISAALHGQDLSSLSAKMLIGERLQYFSVLDDTTLCSSINSYNDTAEYYCERDTLFIKQRYLLTYKTATKWVERLYDYKIIKLTRDTLQLRYTNHAYSHADSILFVNLERLKEDVSDFKFLELAYASPRTGTKKITVDSSGNVTYADNPHMYSVNNPGGDKSAKPKNMKGRLTQKEFEIFKIQLSNSIPSRLPLKRGCAIDGSRSDFKIFIGSKEIRSTGCDLSRIHASLLDYLYDIDRKIVD